MFKIVSGGQTGVDRAALDAAIEAGIDHGGWVPRGRMAEDGVIPDNYRLTETETEDYEERTELNVLDSEGTLIISRGPLQDGSALTRDLAVLHKKPWFHADVGRGVSIFGIRGWLRSEGIRTLNVAGPRASKDPHIYNQARGILVKVIAVEGEYQK